MCVCQLAHTSPRARSHGLRGADGLVKSQEGNSTAQGDQQDKVVSDGRKRSHLRREAAVWGCACEGPS